MSHKLHHQIPIWQALLLGCIIWWLCIWAPVIAWAETAEQEEKTVIDLKDGTVIELTEDAVIRKGKQPDVPDLWSVPAKEPLLPLVFENREGLQLLLYFIQLEEHYGEFRAVRVEDGQEQWVHPVWTGRTPVSPIWVKPWIYFGQGAWLDKMDTDDGKIKERYPARTEIKSLQKQPDGVIEVHAQESAAVGMITLRFQEGQFYPYIAAAGNLLTSISFVKRADFVMQEFVGTLDPFDYEGYLDLHRIKREPMPPEFAIKWRNFDLRKAEEAYHKAYRGDPANPYFALYLALSIYYQGRQIEAEPYFQEAFEKSANFWEESLRLGVICESLGLTQWADAFYEQGAARYFQEVPSPPHVVSLIEVLVDFLKGSRQSSALFAVGQTDRALHLLEIRRQLFPYTEGDNWFSQKYARWLRRMGQEEKAVLEEQRIGKYQYTIDSQDLTPGSLAGFMFAAFGLLGVIILKNEIRHWYELFIAITAMVLIGGVALVPSVKGVRESMIFLLVIFVYISTIAFFRRRKVLRENRGTTPTPSLWRMMLSFALSSYIVLITGAIVAYTLGDQLSRSPVGGKIAEIVFMLVFIGLYRWMRRDHRAHLLLRNLKSFVFVCALLWGYFAWFHYNFGIIIEDAHMRIPSLDRGHPNWQVYIHQKVEEASFQTRDLIVLQALVHQLGGEFDAARQIYVEIANDARALNNLGTMRWDADPSDAQKYFERALAIDSDFAPARYNLGVITSDRTNIERAKTGDPWRVNVYQKYAPEKLWIAMPVQRKWSKAFYWSKGGFPLRGFAEIVVSVFHMLN